ncbi:unnamed protein product, partial [Chrysoparadoxa australica]
MSRPTTRSSAAAAAAITLGCRVSVGERKGVVKFIGTTNFAAGEWIGVELDTSEGKNDGTVNGEHYFDCKDQHGLFVKKAQVQLERSSARSLSQTRSSRASVGSRSSIGAGTSRASIGGKSTLEKKKEKLEEKDKEKEEEKEKDEKEKKGIPPPTSTGASSASSRLQAIREKNQKLKADLAAARAAKAAHASDSVAEAEAAAESTDAGASPGRRSKPKSSTKRPASPARTPAAAAAARARVSPRKPAASSTPKGKRGQQDAGETPVVAAPTRLAAATPRKAPPPPDQEAEVQPPATPATPATATSKVSVPSPRPASPAPSSYAASPNRGKSMIENKIKQLQAELAAKETYIAGMKTEMENLRATAEAATAEAATAKEAASAKTATAETAPAPVVVPGLPSPAFMAEMDALRATNTEQLRQLDESQAACRALDSELDLLKKKHASAATEGKEQAGAAARLQASAASAERKLKECEAQLAEMTDTVEALTL